MKRDHILWVLILIPAVAWFIELEASFAIAPLSSSTLGPMAAFAIGVAMLAVTGVTGWLSWRNWRNPPEAPDGRRPPGQRALSAGALLVNAAFFIVLLAEIIPNFVLATPGL